MSGSRRKRRGGSARQPSGNSRPLSVHSWADLDLWPQLCLTDAPGRAGRASSPLLTLCPNKPSQPAPSANSLTSSGWRGAALIPIWEPLPEGPTAPLKSLSCSPSSALLCGRNVPLLGNLCLFLVSFQLHSKEWSAVLICTDTTFFGGPQRR